MSPSASVRRRGPDDEERDRQERLAYVGALAAGLVHEVRTPLHAMQLNAQMLAEDALRLPEALRPRFERRSRRVCQEARGLSRLLDAVLAFARPPRMEPAPVDLNGFLRDLVEFARPEMDEAGVRVVAETARDMYPVALDQRQFTHVLLNLLRNAREAIEQRREREAADLEGQVRLATEEAEHTISLTVEDNGAGIAPEDEYRIFEAFYTTKAQGSGLGLGIVRRIVEDHRGTIVLEPSPPPGARFRVTLPRGRYLEYAPEERAEEGGYPAAGEG
jgi:signal transduction histidine kinase